MNEPSLERDSFTKTILTEREISTDKKRKRKNQEHKEGEKRVGTETLDNALPFSSLRLHILRLHIRSERVVSLPTCVPVSRSVPGSASVAGPLALLGCFPEPFPPSLSVFRLSCRCGESRSLT